MNFREIQRRVLVLFVGAFAVANVALGQNPGATVVVIYNSDMPESKDVAIHYAERRAVPASQVYGLTLPTTEEITRGQYLELIEQPLLQRLVDNGLWTFQAKPGKKASRDKLGRLEASTIRYAVLCYGVPTKIASDAGLKETGMDQINELLRRNEASVDSQLATLPMEKQTWFGPVTNPAYGATNVASLHPTNGILLVARMDGPTPEIARRLVDLSLEAETHGLWGRAYFDSRGLTNGNLAIGDEWIRKSQQLAAGYGYSTDLDAEEATFSPGYAMSDVAIYAGWYASHASGPFSQPTIDFVPGAFAYHLHSFSAQKLRSTDFNWVGPLLHRGATASIGYVNEPFLTGTADLQTFFARWLFARFTYGEAAWASLNYLSWQSLVVGDPLYRPGLKPPDQLHAELLARQSPLLAWSHLLVVNRHEAMQTPTIEMMNYLNVHAKEMTRTNSILTEKLADLYWNNKKFTDALDYYDMALKRGPSRMQKLRLLLRMGRLREYYGPRKKVIEHYRTVVEEYPEYPEALELYEKLLVLAQEEKDDDLIQECEAAIKKLTQ